MGPSSPAVMLRDIWGNTEAVRSAAPGSGPIPNERHREERRWTDAAALRGDYVLARI